MRKQWTLTGISFIAASVCWQGLHIGRGAVWSIAAVVAVYCSILTIDFLAVSIDTMLRPAASPFKSFAVVNVMLGIATVLLAVGDILTDTDDFLPGFLGFLLLVFIVPFLMFLLIADCILYAIHKSRHP